MKDAALLRLVSIGAAVLLCGIAALLASSVARSNANNNGAGKWWVQAGAFILAAAIIFVGYRIYRSGYAWGSYL